MGIDDIIMFDGDGSPEAQYWITRNRLRSKFGLSAEEADNEDAAEVAIHLKIWEKIADRREWEEKRSAARQQPAGKIN